MGSSYIQLVLGLILTLFTLFSFVLLRRSERSKLNEPPLVPYKYPMIGHTFDYYKDSKGFIKKCKEKYGDTFSLYVFGRVITFVGKELTPEVFRNHKDFNFIEANKEFFPVSGFMHRSDDFFDVVPKMVQTNLSGELRLYTERVQKQLIKSIDEVIGNGKVLKPPLKSIQLIVARPITATFVGEKLSEDKELVESFAYITSDIGTFQPIPPIFNLIHPRLHRKLMILSFLYLHNPFKVHKELIKRKVIPIIEERLGQMKKLGDAYIPPTDLLQRFIEQFQKDYTVDVDTVIDHMIVTIFASVHTTSLFLTYSLQEFANNPQCHKELLEEQVQLYKNNKNSHYLIEEIAKMEKLDSFIKETLRVSTDIVMLEHKTLSPCFTFSSGYQVPKDRIVYVRVEEIHSDEELQGQNPNEFNAFRHLEKKNSSATRVEKNYLIFGLGKHACPGRYFAINEIKVALHHILLRYNVRRDNDNNEKNTSNLYGTSKLPSNEGLTFEKRT